jgi:AcrR family transcriptional regulator
MSQQPEQDKRRTATGETILAIAAEQFAEHGYASVSMRQLAQAIGVTPAALYHHYPDKDALYLAVLRSVFGRGTDMALDMLQREGSPQDRLARVMGVLVRMFAEDEVMMKLLHRELLDGDEERLRTLTEDIMVGPLEAIEQLVITLLPERDARLTTISIIAGIIGHFQLRPMLAHVPGGWTVTDDPATLARHLVSWVLGNDAPIQAQLSLGLGEGE